VGLPTPQSDASIDVSPSGNMWLISGVVQYEPGQSGQRAVVYQAGSWVSIPGPCGDASAFFPTHFAGNPEASVIVGATTAGGCAGDDSAVLWDSQNGTRLLNSVLTSSGIDTSSWSLQNVDAVSGNGLVLAGRGVSAGRTRAWAVVFPAACDSIDFNRDGQFPDVDDITAFLDVFNGASCGTCGDVDFNNDGLFPDVSDIDAILRVFAGGAC
jgi:hypothetical protein